MGKIRVKTFDESGELQEDDKKKAKYEAKKQAKIAAQKESPESTDAVESVITSPVVEETKTPDLETIEASSESTPSEKTKEKPAKKSKKEKFATQRVDSKRHAGNTKTVDKNKMYPLTEALGMLKGLKMSKFDETVELHLNVNEKGISGQVALPHGTGKTLRIVVADDAIIEEITSGKINFDVLIAKPDMMPKLAKVAKVLGPRGLMPNPKNGTITNNPEEAIEKLSAGQVNYKTEAQAPVIHMRVGKISFEDKKLEDNINSVLRSIGATKITQAVLKSTMSPGIKIAVK